MGGQNEGDTIVDNMCDVLICSPIFIFGFLSSIELCVSVFYALCVPCVWHIYSCSWLHSLQMLSYDTSGILYFNWVTRASHYNRSNCHQTYNSVLCLRCGVALNWHKAHDWKRKLKRTDKWKKISTRKIHQQMKKLKKENAIFFRALRMCISLGRKWQIYLLRCTWYPSGWRTLQGVNKWCGDFFNFISLYETSEIFYGICGLFWNLETFWDLSDFFVHFFRLYLRWGWWLRLHFRVRLRKSQKTTRKVSKSLWESREVS